ncbi:double-strand break repair helicase AddA [Devosia sp.]|uniref:double-strand break repair helicase AddA n=1 Tax=Devosia sp. TaxID=1871048 RepID=UPI0025EB0ECE|nr:double-strand break repair helicase AddA [Devosia sp.]MCR6635590.1 double-strand break repair helicase AddA [Devosia sp.]
MSAERGELSVPFDTRSAQSRATDPSHSIWVEANAGSGKTFVLTRRVLRLLLAGVKPESILCLTYTKAAAAEMRKRVSQQLAEWAVIAEGELRKKLTDLLGTQPDAKTLHAARTLFARALETPGGLRILTIHAFCEAVLHRFPIEAGVPFDFSVIEEDQQIQLILAARESVLAEGLRGGANGAAVETLFQLLSDHHIGEAIGAALSKGARLKPLLADPEGAKVRLKRLAGAGSESATDLLESAARDTLLTPEVLRHLVSALGGNPHGHRKCVDALARLDPERPDRETLHAAFFTTEGKPRTSLLTKAERHAHPHVFETLIREQDRLIALDEKIRAARLVERSNAVLDILVAIARRYENDKRRRALLDFDDLVDRLGDLLDNLEIGPWVQYKLDAGIEHILVDESQDTNDQQWRVVRALAAEFFVGEGATRRPRSVFAVGDQKQSIYSFQGAQPALFGTTGYDFARRAEAADMAFARLPLHTSFRTLSGILEAVDKVCARSDIQLALLATDRVLHTAARSQPGGTVTLWPPVQAQKSEAGDGQWPLEPLEAEQSAARQVAMRIAREIRSWIDNGRPLTQRGRAVTADDVLILVQSRSALFQEIIRALRLYHVPTPGADRLAVTGHIAVLDLLALIDVLLNPADDLQLAALLRSPLFDFSEDDLFNLASTRSDRQTLWSALLASALPAARAAAERLAAWRANLDFERPFEFLTKVLYADQGLKRFHARLGTEVDEVISEFLELALNHEQNAQPSLQGFAADMRQRNVSIKRELAEGGGGVRVMTVHGAKGLEAPIVIMADAASKPAAKQIGSPIYIVSETPGPLLIHASNKAQHVPATLEIKEKTDANLAQEYWRKLYVAMTRAEDELYVTGALTQNGKLDGTWYEAVESALSDNAEVLELADGTSALVYPIVRPQPAAITGSTTASAKPARWVEPEPLPAFVPPATTSPSRAHEASGNEPALATAAERVRDAETARKSGIALHALLQHLGRIDRGLWPNVIPRALEVLLPDMPKEQARLAPKALSILDSLEFAYLFGPDSRAEVPFLVDAIRDGEPIRLSGRMDRLVVDDHSVLVIDYKSDATAPKTAVDVPPRYVTQLSLYALVASQLFPGRTVRAAILWTELESLMNLPSELLEQARGNFTLK